MSAAPSFTTTTPKTRNPKTHAIIRREMLQQVYLPLGLALAIVLTLCVAVCLPGAATARSPLADVSLMFLIMIVGFNGLIVLAVIVGLVWLVYYGLRELPFLFKRAQDFVWFVSMQAKSVTTQVDSRVVAVHVSTATVKGLIVGLRTIFSPDGAGRPR
jgi:FtsH-binding integral membrane protein